MLCQQVTFFSHSSKKGLQTEKVLLFYYSFCKEDPVLWKEMVLLQVIRIHLKLCILREKLFFTTQLFIFDTSFKKKSIPPIKNIVLWKLITWLIFGYVSAVLFLRFNWTTQKNPDPIFPLLEQEKNLIQFVMNSLYRGIRFRDQELIKKPKIESSFRQKSPVESGNGILMTCRASKNELFEEGKDIELMEHFLMWVKGWCHLGERG